MTTLTMKRFSNVTFTLLLAAIVAVSLSACAEGQTGETGVEDTTGVAGEDPSMTGGPGGMQDGMQQGGMQQDSVSLQGTVQLFEEGITQASTQAAVQNIEGWEQKLGDLTVSGQAQQPVSDITSALGDLKSALQGGGQPDEQAVSQAFSQIDEAMTTLMQNAQGLNLQAQQEERLSRLQKAIQQAQQKLGGGGGM
ncbi:MAG: hypothetical protein BRD38_02790 [Bacteroidetes bacterium QH_9_67_14]|nr:MAG: hypothetical protein BRD38_02790 [Bacteroidetes bacterium QH_9_67_14]